MTRAFIIFFEMKKKTYSLLYVAVQVSLYENFLRIADLVLSWNFENFRLPIRITFPSEGTPAAILRPPESWKRIFQSGEFLPLFFEVGSCCMFLTEAKTKFELNRRYHTEWSSSKCISDMKHSPLNANTLLKIPRIFIP